MLCLKEVKMMRCSDDWMNARLLRAMFEVGRPRFVNCRCITKEVNMKRFESVKVENETLNDIYGTEIYKIRDNLDEDSPVSNYRALKKSTDELVDWLNENIKEVELTPYEKLENVLSRLYEPDEIHLNYYNEMFFIVEIKDTCVTRQDIANALGIDTYSIIMDAMGNNRSIYKIWESCLE